MTRSFAVTLSRFMLRTASTPLNTMWSLAYWSVTRAAVACVRGTHHEASIYLKGSFAVGEEVYGISDVDMVVVLPGNGSDAYSIQQAARENWKQLCKRFRIFSFVIQHCWFYEESDLSESTSASCLTYGLSLNDDGQEDDRPAFLGPHPLLDHMGLQTHPLLYGGRSEWTRLAGLDRLSRQATGDAQSRRLASWLHLQYWWRHAFLACAEPARDHVSLMCVKLIAEPLRLWLWVERGETVATREAALERGLSESPEERELFQLGLDLFKALHRSPTPPLGEVIAGLLRQSERLALHMCGAAEAAGFLEVRLAGSDGLAVIPDGMDRMRGIEERGNAFELLPLADWRTRAVPGVPDETLVVMRPNVVDPDFLAEVARADGGPGIIGMLYNSMLLLPTTDPERGMLRAVQCQPTDPVSFALANRRTVALFPKLAGWSAVDSARRAVAEHRSWLIASDHVCPPHGWVGMQSPPHDGSMRTLGLLFTAARAGLFLESISEGEPVLAVTFAGVAECLIARDASCRNAVEDALDNFRRPRPDGRTSAQCVSEMLDVVRNLSAYSGSRDFSVAAR